MSSDLFYPYVPKNKKHKDVQEKMDINTSKYQYYVWCDDFYTKCFYVFYKFLQYALQSGKNKKIFLKNIFY